MILDSADSTDTDLEIIGRLEEDEWMPSCSLVKKLTYVDYVNINTDIGYLQAKAYYKSFKRQYEFFASIMNQVFTRFFDK